MSFDSFPDEFDVDIGGQKRRVHVEKGRCLGSGGIGKVHPASFIDTDSNDKVEKMVVKAAKEEQFSSFILEEAKLMRKLGAGHANIVKLVAVAEPSTTTTSSSTAKGTSAEGAVPGEKAAAAAEQENDGISKSTAVTTSTSTIITTTCPTYAATTSTTEATTITTAAAATSVAPVTSTGAGEDHRTASLKVALLLLSPRCQRSLHDLLVEERKGERLPLEDTAATTVGILRALDFLIATGLAHRDLSAPNILVNGSVGSGALRPYVTDFSWAVDTGKGKEVGGDIAGRVGYMATETLFGAKRQQLADLQSAGLLLLFVLRGGNGVLDEELLEEGDIQGGEDAVPRQKLKVELSKLCGRPDADTLEEMEARYASREGMSVSPTVDAGKLVEAEVTGKANAQKFKQVVKGFLSNRPSVRTRPWTAISILAPLIPLKMKQEMPDLTNEEKARAARELGSGNGKDLVDMFKK